MCIQHAPKEPICSRNRLSISPEHLLYGLVRCLAISTNHFHEPENASDMRARLKWSVCTCALHIADERLCTNVECGALVGVGEEHLLKMLAPVPPHGRAPDTASAAAGENAALLKRWLNC